MAFERENLSNLASGATRVEIAGQQLHFQLWFYATDDDEATLLGAGYFVKAGTDTSAGGDGTLNDGDLIYAITSVGGVPVYKLYVVTDAAAGTVAALVQP